MTRHRSVSMLLGTLPWPPAWSSTFAAPASARIVEREIFHDEFSDTIDDFCDVEDSTVDFDGHRRRSLPGQRPRARVASTTSSRRPQSCSVYTDQATGQIGHRHPAEHHRQGPQAHRQRRRHHHDHRAADGWRAGRYGDDGKLIAKNSGQIRLEIVYDYVNDVEISNELIFGSTGTNDDFCEAVLTDWGYLN